MSIASINSEARPLSGATVGDAMQAELISCTPDTPAAEVAALMARHRIHCLPVVRTAHDGSGEPYVWGIVTDRDLLAAAVSGEDAATAAQLADGPVLLLRTAMTLDDAARLMVAHRAAHAVVISSGGPVPIGILSTLDIVHRLGGAQPACEPIGGAA